VSDSNGAIVNRAKVDDDVNRIIEHSAAGENPFGWRADEGILIAVNPSAPHPLPKRTLVHELGHWYGLTYHPEDSADARAAYGLTEAEEEYNFMTTSVVFQQGGSASSLSTQQQIDIMLNNME